MLYDTRWEKPEIKADPFSLESLIAWLEKHPADEVYYYYSNGECLLARYFTEAGFQNVSMFTYCFWHGQKPLPETWGADEAFASGKAIRLPAHFNSIASKTDHTFGAALSRARKALAGRT